MMEKNGNTLSQGDKVTRRQSGTKQASTQDQGEVKHVDIDNGEVLVKWASGTEERLPLAELERLG